ncbi:MAG: polysaccharide biosynthesis/export family protein [Geobacteraceae bacterium]|nr:polysaccharide biosynthesis/export family protein [Geobacteraceae bacterium]
MYIKKMVCVTAILSAFGTFSAWALGEPAAEVINLIEPERAVPVNDDAVERAARIEAARKDAADKRAEEKAVAQRIEKERLAAQKQAESSKAAEASTQAAPLQSSKTENIPVEKGAVIAAKSETKEIPSTVKPDRGVTGNQVTSVDETKSSDYIIGPGDQIGISVWRDENLTRTVNVLPDGKITLPLVGDFIAAGKTVDQLKAEVQKSLARYTGDTAVTVEVKQSNSMIIYITGRVNLPGKQLLMANTNVLQAIAMAGGLNPFARKSGIRIFRQHDGTTDMYSFNYADVMEGRHLEMNIDLKRGDVIIVP